jgi:hypothetical protein
MSECPMPPSTQEANRLLARVCGCRVNLIAAGSILLNKHTGEPGSGFTAWNAVGGWQREPGDTLRDTTRVDEP